MICLNGAAAGLSSGDLIIIISYGIFDREEAKTFNPKVVFVDEKNKIIILKAKRSMGKYEG